MIWLVPGVVLYVVLLLGMLVYGLNTVLLVAVHAATRKNLPRPPPPEDLPVVTVQLPVFNEENVVGRLLQCASALDWPRDRLEIQLLDDSTDGTPEVAAPILEQMRARGLDVHHLKRTDRTAYKAGALAEGLKRARGSLVAIFDADFAPPPDFLRRAVVHLDDRDVAAVQGRWTHLNRDYSALTRAQALAIDGHFGVEQGARCAMGWFLNFNGSAGVWRRSAIDDAGGWSGDTLTEDLDLSYRAQLAGWRIVYDPDLVCPGELPIHLAAFKSQQRRWATGSMQTARKLLPRIWRAPLPLLLKLQATLHLTHYGVHVLIAATALLSVPCLFLPGVASEGRGLYGFVLPFLLAMSGPTLLHVYAQRVLEGRWVRFRELGLLTLFGIGIAVSNGAAVLAAFRPSGGEFVRTPKLGVVQRQIRAVRSYRAAPDGLTGLEGALAAYCVIAALSLGWARVFEVTPFLFLDGLAFAVVAAVGSAEARA